MKVLILSDCFFITSNVVNLVVEALSLDTEIVVVDLRDEISLLLNTTNEPVYVDIPDVLHHESYTLFETVPKRL